MATIAQICIKLKNGKLKGVRCNYDGYLKHTGKILLENYNTPTLITKLISLGDISVLEPKMNKPAGHTFSTPTPGYTIFYGRDRGEKNTSAKTYDNVEEIFDYENVDYVYVFDKELNCWYFCKYDGEIETLTKGDIMATGGGVGKIIGTLKSGKPIYSKTFTDNDSGQIDIKDPNSTGPKHIEKYAKTLPNGNHGIQVATRGGRKRYLVIKKDNEIEIQPVSKSIYDKATGVKSFTAYSGVSDIEFPGRPNSIWSKMAKGGYLEGREEYRGFQYQIWYNPKKGMYSVSDNIGIFEGDNQYFKKYDQAKEHAEISISSKLSEDEEYGKGGEIQSFIDDFILDDVDWDDIRKKSDLMKNAKEIVVSNLSEYGITKFEDLSKQQQMQVKTIVDDEWNAYQSDEEYGKGGGIDNSNLESIGNLIDEMQDNEEGLDQGLNPSELIDYELIKEKCNKIGHKIDIKKLKFMAKQNDQGFIYSGSEMLNNCITKYAKGGNLEQENREMLKNQIIEAKHHADELGRVVNKNTYVEPWVVAKTERATSDLSDVTHYLDGRNKMAKGGEVDSRKLLIEFNLPIKTINPYSGYFNGRKKFDNFKNKLSSYVQSYVLNNLSEFINDSIENYKYEQFLGYREYQKTKQPKIEKSNKNNVKFSLSFKEIENSFGGELDLSLFEKDKLNDFKIYFTEDLKEHILRNIEDFVDYSSMNEISVKNESNNQVTGELTIPGYGTFGVLQNENIPEKAFLYKRNNEGKMESYPEGHNGGAYIDNTKNFIEILLEWFKRTAWDAPENKILIEKIEKNEFQTKMSKGGGVGEPVFVEGDKVRILQTNDHTGEKYDLGETFTINFIEDTGGDDLYYGENKEYLFHPSDLELVESGEIPGLNPENELNSDEVENLYEIEPKLDDPYYPKKLIRQVLDIAYYKVIVDGNEYVLAMDTKGNWDDKWYLVKQSKLNKVGNGMQKVFSATYAPKEPGAAGVRIELEEGNVNVYHTDSNEILLSLKDVPQGTWKKLWDFLRNDLVKK